MRGLDMTNGHHTTTCHDVHLHFVSSSHAHARYILFYYICKFYIYKNKKNQKYIIVKIILFTISLYYTSYKKKKIYKRKRKNLEYSIIFNIWYALLAQVLQCCSVGIIPTQPLKFLKNYEH